MTIATMFGSTLILGSMLCLVVLVLSFRGRK